MEANKLQVVKYSLDPLRKAGWISSDAWTTPMMNKGAVNWVECCGRVVLQIAYLLPLRMLLYRTMQRSATSPPIMHIKKHSNS